MVRGDWKGRERPVLVNNWEAHFFKFNSGKLLRLARRAKRAGVELFVLDDGWFGKRNDDHAGLGDYNVNRRKLPLGMQAFAARIHRMGLLFGLWFEPEMVNPDSSLYRAHPEYALQTPGKTSALGRNQLVLDLCNPDVRDYIVTNVCHLLDSSKIDYVKWDYNRHISDAFSASLAQPGMFFHRYMLGLYDVLTRIFTPRPHILLESCSSGGNRFDLGMLCYSPQIWASDNTDPVERLRIQGGLSYLYPLSAMGAHVSQAPHQQTLRNTPLSTRFNVAVFGCLGYELDLRELTPVQRADVRRQISFYKQHRALMQYGVFLRGEPINDRQTAWHCVARDGKAAVSGMFQQRAPVGGGFDRLRLMGLAPDEYYHVESRPQSLYLQRFGGLVKHVLPVTMRPDGLLFRILNRWYRLTDGQDAFAGYGAALMDGVLLGSQFSGTGSGPGIRLWGDYGSGLYIAGAKDAPTPQEQAG